ncbi:MAG: winged helix-turn-helix domain-containing protein [Haloferacaceae archaeon]
MEAVLWQVLAGTRGGPNRVRILKALDERPRNANRLAEHLGLAYQTVRHHLEVFGRNDVVISADEDYGNVYLPSDRARRNWDTVERIVEQVDTS